MTRKREQWSASKVIFDAGQRWTHGTHRSIVWFASITELEVIGRVTTGKVSATNETAGAL